MADFNSSLTPQPHIQSSPLENQAQPRVVKRSYSASQKAKLDKKVDAAKTNSIAGASSTAPSNAVANISASAIKNQEKTESTPKGPSETFMQSSPKRVKVVYKIYRRATPPGPIATQIAHPKTPSEKPVRTDATHATQKASQATPTHTSSTEKHAETTNSPESPKTAPLSENKASTNSGPQQIATNNQASGPSALPKYAGEDNKTSILHEKTIAVIDSAALPKEVETPTKAAESKKRELEAPKNNLDQTRTEFVAKLQEAQKRIDKVANEEKKLTYIGEKIEVVDRDKSIASPLLQGRIATHESTKKAVEVQLDELISLAHACSVCGDIDGAKTLQNTINSFLGYSWTQAAIRNNPDFKERVANLKELSSNIVNNTAKAVVTESLSKLRNNELIQKALTDEGSPQDAEAALSLINNSFASGLGIDSSSKTAVTVFSDRTSAALSSFRNEVTSKLTEKALSHLVDTAVASGDTSNLSSFIASQPDKSSLHNLASKFGDVALQGKSGKEFIRQTIAEGNIYTLLKLALDPKYNQEQLQKFDPGLRAKVQEAVPRLIGGIFTQDNATPNFIAQTLKKIAEEAVGSRDSKQCDNIAKFCEKWIVTNSKMPGFEESREIFNEIGTILKQDFGAHETRVRVALLKTQEKTPPLSKDSHSLSAVNILKDAIKSSATKEEYLKAIYTLKHDFNALAAEALHSTPPGLFALNPKEVTAHESSKNATKFFEDTTAFVRENILKIEDPAERQKVIEFFLDLGHALAADQDFFTSQAILSGLNDSSVRRLFSKEDQIFLGDSHKDKLSKLETLFSTSMNFANVHRAIDNALESKQSFIPPFNLYATQRTFLHDGNQHLGNITQTEITCTADITDIISQAQKNTQHPQALKSSIAQEIASTGASALNDKERFELSLKLVPRSLSKPQEAIASEETLKAFRAIASTTKEAQNLLESDSAIKEFADLIQNKAIQNLKGKERQEALLKIKGEILEQIQQTIIDKGSKPTQDDIKISLVKHALKHPSLSSEFKIQLINEHFAGRLEAFNSDEAYKTAKDMLQQHVSVLAQALVMKDPTLDLTTIYEEILEAYTLTAAVNNQLESINLPFALERAPFSGILNEKLQKAVVDHLIGEAISEVNYDLIVELMNESPSDKSESVSDKEAQKEGISLKDLPFDKRLEYQAKLASLGVAKNHFKKHPEIKQLCKDIADASFSWMKEENNAQRAEETIKLRLELYKTIQDVIIKHKNNESDDTPLDRAIYRTLHNEIMKPDSPLSGADQRELLLKMLEGSKTLMIPRKAFESNLFKDEMDRATDSISQGSKKSLINDKLSAKAIAFAMLPVLNAHDSSKLDMVGFSRFITAGINKAVKESPDLDFKAKITFFKSSYEKKVSTESEESQKLKEAHNEFSNYIARSLNGLSYSHKEIAEFEDEVDLILYSAIYNGSASDAQGLIEALRRSIDNMTSSKAKEIARAILNKELEQKAAELASQAQKFFKDMADKKDAAGEAFVISKSDIDTFKDSIRTIQSYTQSLESLNKPADEIRAELDSFVKKIGTFMSYVKTSADNFQIDKQVYNKLNTDIMNTSSDHALSSAGFSSDQIKRIKSEYIG